MTISVDAAVTALRALIAEPVPRDGAGPAGPPSAEYTRSPAARRIGELSLREGLFLFHYEHRSIADLPEDWGVPGQPELVLAPEWDAGVLPERKYQSFRHDLAIGGFNPGHRAKWTTHELCHGLVGFAWWPGQSQLALATASRMAELLPVALWYFFDEAFLARCPEHAGGGPLFRTFCPACEDCAGPTRDDPRAAKRIEDGLSFIDRELAAIARSRREGRPISSTWATINLCSDGLAYAHAHGRRLQSEAFRQYMVHFGVEGGGYVSTLDALQARLEDVLHGLLGLRQPAALAPDAERGQARWMLQDVGWRLLATWHECEGEAQQQVWDLAMRLAQGLTDGEPPGLEVARARLAEAVSTWQRLEEEWVLPDADHIFGVGYPLADGWGTGWSQLGDGIDSSCPRARLLLRPDTARRFASADPWVRQPLARRFSDWAALEEPDLADLIAFETAVCCATPDRSQHLLPPDEGESLGLWPGARILYGTRDPIAVADAVEAGDVTRGSEGLEGLEDIPERSTAVLIARPGTELLVLDLDLDDALALEQDRADDVAPESLATLVELGVVVPRRWTL